MPTHSISTDNDSICTMYVISWQHEFTCWMNFFCFIVATADERVLRTLRYCAIVITPCLLFQNQWVPSRSWCDSIWNAIKKIYSLTWHNQIIFMFRFSILVALLSLLLFEVFRFSFAQSSVLICFLVASCKFVCIFFCGFHKGQWWSTSTCFWS